MKLALTLFYSQWRERKAHKEVRMVACVHDQLTITCKKEVAQEWEEILTTSLLDAAKVAVPSGLLGVDVNQTEKWSK